MNSDAKPIGVYTICNTMWTSIYEIDPCGEWVRARMENSGNCTGPVRKHKIYSLKDGRTFFVICRMRIFLDDCMRTDCPACGGI